MLCSIFKNDVLLVVLFISILNVYLSLSRFLHVCGLIQQNLGYNKKKALRSNKPRNHFFMFVLVYVGCEKLKMDLSITQILFLTFMQ